MTEVKINTEYIKLDQFLKWAGIAESGADAKEMVGGGKVNVNGKEETQRGKKLHRGDRVVVEGLGEFQVV